MENFNLTADIFLYNRIRKTLIHKMVSDQTHSFIMTSGLFL